MPAAGSNFVDAITVPRLPQHRLAEQGEEVLAARSQSQEPAGPLPRSRLIPQVPGAVGGRELYAERLPVDGTGQDSRLNGQNQEIPGTSPVHRIPAQKLRARAGAETQIQHIQSMRLAHTHRINGGHAARAADQQHSVRRRQARLPRPLGFVDAMKETHLRVPPERVHRPQDPRQDRGRQQRER